MSSFKVILPASPPTVTHQAKVIGWRRSARTGKTWKGLRDSDELRLARDTYIKLLRASRQKPRTPVAGPVHLAIAFCWLGEARAFYLQKPDWDNAAKTLQDVLVEEGWIEDDRAVAVALVWKLAAPTAFVRVAAHTLDVREAEVLLAAMEEGTLVY